MSKLNPAEAGSNEIQTSNWKAYALRFYQGKIILPFVI
jgi:hypothetical protein